MTYTIRLSPQAALQIRAAASWWSKNRTKAPGALREEIAKAFELARSWPSAGERVPHPLHADIRRILLSRTRYHLYYRIVRESESIEILALWHTSRGAMPPLMSTI